MSVFGKGASRICAVVATPSARRFPELVRRACLETPTVELRLDWLRTDQERQRALRWLKRRGPGRAVFIATCRRRVGGGEFAGGAEEELFWLVRAHQAGCQWCDLEIETLRELSGPVLERWPLPSKVMLSIHDFRCTPRLPVKVQVAARGAVDAVKIAAMSRKLSDSTRLLRLVRGTKRVVAVPMGEIGLPARILSLREGSALVYAPVEAATAPGQVPLQEAKHLYRAHQLTKRTAIYGVIGDPVAHSLSPLLHNTGYVAARRDAVYLPFLVERLGEFLPLARNWDVRGFSVTLPHKRAIFRYLDGCEELAEQVGAVNTVTVSRDGSWHGENTDLQGVLRALEGKVRLPGSRVLIFGAGGAARAAAFAVSRAGGNVLISARRMAAARELARAVGGDVIGRPALRRESFDAILNATPVGMYPHAEASPLEACELRCALVMDLVYRPLRTRLLTLAEARGIETVSGVEMFLAQGIAQWEHWMGCGAPGPAMRRAVLGQLRAEEKTQR